MKRRPTPDPRYPLQGFRVLGPEPRPGITFVRLDEVEAYSTNVLTGETTRLGPEHDFVKMFDQVERVAFEAFDPERRGTVVPIEALIGSINGHVRLALEALHDRPTEGMATITPITRSTT